MPRETSTDDSRPVPPDRRISSIDVLRAIALFGVLAVNLINEFRVSIFQQFLPLIAGGSWWDHAVETAVSVGLELKAFALFSILFGVGLAIQFERLAGNPTRGKLLVRRLLVLLGFGLVHLCLVWNGDILTEYALVGLLALPALYVSNRPVAIAGLVALVIYAALPLWLPPTFFPGDAWLRQHVAEATLAYSQGSWSEVVRYNLREIPDLRPLHLLVALRTFGLFLLGMAVWRTGLLRQPERYRPLISGAAVLGLVLGFGMSVLDPPGPSSPFHAWGSIVSMMTTIAPVVLAIGYGASIVAFFAFTRASRVLRVFAPLGRMAFTNYLAQSLIFGWIFFGYGLGLFGRMSASHAIVIGMAVYLVQIAWSHWWLRRFRFGPMEWLWRTLMYGTRQSWRISRPTTSESAPSTREPPTPD